MGAEEPYLWKKSLLLTSKETPLCSLVAAGSVKMTLMVQLSESSSLENRYRRNWKVNATCLRKFPKV